MLLAIAQQKNGDTVRKSKMNRIKYIMKRTEKKSRKRETRKRHAMLIFRVRLPKIVAWYRSKVDVKNAEVLEEQGIIVYVENKRRVAPRVFRPVHKACRTRSPSKYPASNVASGRSKN